MIREKLTEVLGQYMLDTLSHVATVREFCDGLSGWSLQRETELETMRDIQNRAEGINLKFKHVSESPNKRKALGEYLKSLTNMKADQQWEELERELSVVLKNTLAGLEKLDHFLDAVERLAVTSVFVFDEECPLGDQEVSLADVRDVIAASQEACPLLVRFKRKAQDFFLPILYNVQVLAIQLDSYLCCTQQLCDKLQSKLMTVSQTESKPSFAFHISQWMFGGKKKKNLDLKQVSDTSVLNMLDHVQYLSYVRTNQDFRLVFLFQEEAENFMELFIQRKPRMLQFLSDLEGSAVQLDNMKRGAQISTVAGSSVGAVGGVLSIVGLALAPFTAGVSLALTITGVGMGITSGVNSVVTTVTETAVNVTQQKKANEMFQSFMEDVANLQGCLEVVSTKMAPELDTIVGAGRIAGKVGAIGKGIDSLIDCASGVKLLRAEDTLADIGQAAKGTPLALSKAARGGLITLNALFIGMDVFFICKEGISLAKGRKSEVSQLIRARARLWHSEVEAWQNIHDSLQKGLLTSKDSLGKLKMPFYPV